MWPAEREGKVKVKIVNGVSAESILRETIEKVKRGSIIYTDRFGDLAQKPSLCHTLLTKLAL